MKRLATAALIAGVVLTTSVSVASAALYYRGNGLVYDAEHASITAPIKSIWKIVGQC